MTWAGCRVQVLASMISGNIYIWGNHIMGDNLVRISMILIDLYIYIYSGQIIIIHLPEIRPFWDDSSY
jgi:hypothetical protein